MSLILEYHIAEAVAALKKGCILKFPSDTVWGLACAMSESEAVLKLRQVQDFSNHTLHELLVCDEFMLNKYVTKIHPRVDTLLHYYQRPLTVVHKSTMNLPAYLLPETDKIGFRLTRNQFCESVIHDLACPLYFLSFYRLKHLNTQATRKMLESLVDHEVAESCYDPLEKRSSRIVSYDQGGRLIFHN
ncbi:MAG TPA: Sua5/YciO/YrdC/YwlC family protein [Saprospiraceae bacterium]|nr:Sua5/YciO/YrdC/YwlC family protein [Saprospiraceae bacterium]